MSDLDAIQPDECPEYFLRYTVQAPAGPLVQAMEAQTQEASDFLATIDEERSTFRYGPDKWSLREVLGHITDTERIFAYRALCCARGEPAAQPGYEQDPYVEAGRFDERSWADLMGEFEAVRLSNLYLFRSFDDAAMHRRGRAAGGEFTARALGAVILGHFTHHRGVIEERYLDGTQE